MSSNPNDNMPATCPFCGKASGTPRTYSDDVDFRGIVLSVEHLEEMICDNCSQTWKTEAQQHTYAKIVKQAYAVARDRIRANQGLLRADDIRRIRESLSLTQRDAADLFGGGANAFNKYESGEVLQSIPMDRLLRLTYAIGAAAVQILKAVEISPAAYSIPVISVISPQFANESFRIGTANAPLIVTFATRSNVTSGQWTH